jgi:hypothetical protein
MDSLIKFEKDTLISVVTNYFHNEKITAYYEKSHTIEKKSQMQAQSTPRLFLCSLCLRVCSLSGSHDQMRLTVRNDIHCCCLTCVRATYSRTKKSDGWRGLAKWAKMSQKCRSLIYCIQGYHTEQQSFLYEPFLKSSLHSNVLVITELLFSSNFNV